MRKRGRLWLTVTTVVTLALTAATAPALGATGTGGFSLLPTFGADDYSGGNAMYILPAGENGLVNQQQFLKFVKHGTRPPYSQSELAPYENLAFGYRSLTNSALSNYYLNESFGIKPGQVIRTEHPSPKVPVVIYRDQDDIPHIYGATNAALSFGAGYAQAQDRLFMMDVLRHYGEGTLTGFLGNSCADEQMDHDELLLAPYTTAQANAQLNNLPKEYGTQGKLALEMIRNYVQGVNDYISQAEKNASMMPVEYDVFGQPKPWTAADVVAIASLIGGIFGDGGGGEIGNSGLLEYLQKVLGQKAGTGAFSQFKEQNDPAAPATVVDKSFPYEIPGKVNPATTAIPDNPGAPLQGGPTDTTPGCTSGGLTPSTKYGLSIVEGLLEFPSQMSNALVVGASHSASGHPVAVFGPQVAYFAPEILMQEDLHSPSYDAMGASFPGTGLVELGRGVDYAWSATSAGSDLTDQRLELICNPNGGHVSATGTDYMFDGKCIPMTNETFQDGTGLTHKIHLTVHGVVQGWTTALGGKPVAVVNQRSTYNHDVDSIIGFLHFGEPALTYSPQSWMKGASEVDYTFNWFYIDNKNIAYYASGLDPVRPSDVNPNLPTWGTGNSEWLGYLPAAKHVHEINPPQGFFDSWNNKPAPLFSAADDQYGYGPSYRVQMLTTQIRHQFAIHHGKITQANLVQAMETAATQDLDGLTILPAFLQAVHGRGEPAGVQQMLAALRVWAKSGAHRQLSSAGDSQYEQADAIAIMDQLTPAIIKAIFDPLFASGGTNSNGYDVFPMGFTNAPDSHQGSAYDGGWEGYTEMALDQMVGKKVADPFGSAVTSRLCGAGGLSNCGPELDAALESAYQALVTANGGSTNVALWTADSATAAAGVTMPEFDNIQYQTLGIVGQPDMPWQNRSTFQQVISFTRHRPVA
ncbi:MAG TPA: penicillin acylase family protein [Streptosporangiaceae bacterium]|jgi:acyl-homoserine lactone acylase PvdQ|nr:penicillin acylase family protein [Streptosporangiaceae bacterium]